MNVLAGLWRKWKDLAGKIGRFQGRVLLSLFYYLVLAPFALVVVVFLDPLRMKRSNSLQWLPLAPSDGDRETLARRQF